MNKKRSKLYWPSLWMYFLVLGGFIVAAFALGYYVLAAGETAILLLLVLFYVLCKQRRHKMLQNFVKNTFSTNKSIKETESPFPMALVRLGDGSILSANDRFAAITGYRDHSVCSNH